MLHGRKANPEEPSREPVARDLARGLQRDLELIRVGLRPAFESWLPALRTALDASIALAHRISWTQGGPVLRSLHTDGFDCEAHRLAERYFQQPGPRWGLFDPANPEPGQRNVPLRLLDVASREQLRNSPFGRGLLAPLGLLEHDVMRVLVCEGDELLAWVCVARKVPFAADERALLAELIEPLRRRLVLEDRLTQVLLPTMPLEQALAAAEPAPSSPGPRAQSTVPGSKVEESGVFARMEDGGDGNGVTSRRKVQLDRADQVWKLTPRQRQVLELVVTGMSNKEIAKTLDCAIRTAELHVTLLLQKASCDSRTELMSRFFSTF